MKSKWKKRLKIALYIIVTLLLIDFLLPTKIQNPVEGCGRESYNQKSFWHPWGDHMHNGIDIFAKKGNSGYGYSCNHVTFFL